MNISTAAKYMQLGYRIRRRAWVALSYAYNLHGAMWGKGKIVGEFPLSLSVIDLLADDWEVITEGIVKNFPITYQE